MLIKTEGLVACYPFNGNVNDEGGNGFDATNVGAIPATDRFGNDNRAYAFDGNNGTERYIYSNIGAHQTITFCAWFKSPHPTTYYPIIIFFGTTKSIHIQRLGNNPYYISTGKEGKLMTGSASATPGEWKAYIESDNRFDDNSWHFVVSM